MNGGWAVFLKHYFSLKDVKALCRKKRRASGGLCGFKQAWNQVTHWFQQHFAPAKVQEGHKTATIAPCRTLNTTQLKCHTLQLIAVLLRLHQLVCSTQQAQTRTLHSAVHSQLQLYTSTSCSCLIGHGSTRCFFCCWHSWQ